MKAATVLLTSLLLLAGLMMGQESQPSPPPSPAPVPIAPWVLHSKLKQADVPEYPKEARENQIVGDITIDVVVDEKGNVAGAQWVNDGTSTILGDAALEAVGKWKYEPTLVYGKPIMVTSWVVIRFQLAKEPNVEILTRTEGSTPARNAVHKGPFRVRISSGVAQGLLVHKVEPDYPFEAKVHHIHGDVVVQCLIDKAGNLVVLNVLSGHPILAEETVRTIRKWKYKPYTINGEPVEAETTITVRFHMY
ncbi:MAG TPA: energy transducer TonB [Candidatus Angelobacter sp.]